MKNNWFSSLVLERGQMVHMVPKCAQMVHLVFQPGHIYVITSAKTAQAHVFSNDFSTIIRSYFAKDELCYYQKWFSTVF